MGTNESGGCSVRGPLAVGVVRGGTPPAVVRRNGEGGGGGGGDGVRGGRRDGGGLRAGPALGPSHRGGQQDGLVPSPPPAPPSDHGFPRVEERHPASCTARILEVRPPSPWGGEALGGAARRRRPGRGAACRTASGAPAARDPWDRGDPDENESTSASVGLGRTMGAILPASWGRGVAFPSTHCRGPLDCRSPRR